MIDSIHYGICRTTRQHEKRGRAKLEFADFRLRASSLPRGNRIATWKVFSRVNSLPPILKFGDLCESYEFLYVLYRQMMVHVSSRTTHRRHHPTKPNARHRSSSAAAARPPLTIKPQAAIRHLSLECGTWYLCTLRRHRLYCLLLLLLPTTTTIVVVISHSHCHATFRRRSCLEY